MCEEYLKLGTAHAVPAHVFGLLGDGLEHATRVDSQKLVRLLVLEVDEEKRDVVLPWQATESIQVDLADEIAVTVALVGYEQLYGVRLVVH